MDPAPNFARTVRSLLREQLLDAAAELTCAQGWAAVTMGKVAVRVGVSRQTVYKELGGKPAMAEALMLRETDRFAAGVAEVIAEHAEPVAGVTAAARFTLESAMDNPLLKTVLAGPFGETDSLLPLLTTDSGAVLARSVETVTPMFMARYRDAPLSGPEWEVAVETVVRLLLSHLVQPSGPVHQVVDQLHWVIERVLRG
ncbi:TetR/AcrR family transcriptional regulator [Amycolatopsis nigrescens]|uniref:TetR/AcrR family transcriptional regulator n=1 Tax=Amycolatopsis nigrescens TaxID=381445 RepID=UPI00039B7954|nr:TetR family transcriptional regulator [Amycolatopsis nigrescens]